MTDEWQQSEEKKKTTTTKSVQSENRKIAHYEKLNRNRKPCHDYLLYMGIMRMAIGAHDGRQQRIERSEDCNIRRWRLLKQRANNKTNGSTAYIPNEPHRQIIYLWSVAMNIFALTRDRIRRRLKFRINK